MALGDHEAASTSFRAALELHPWMGQTVVNLQRSQALLEPVEMTVDQLHMEVLRGDPEGRAR